MVSYLDFINSDVVGLVFVYIKDINEKALLHLSEHEPFKIVFSNKYIFSNKLVHDHPWMDVSFCDILEKFGTNHINNVSTYLLIIEIVEQTVRNIDIVSIGERDMDKSMEKYFNKTYEYFSRLSNMKMDDILGFSITINYLNRKVLRLISKNSNTPEVIKSLTIDVTVSNNIIFSYFLSKNILLRNKR